MAKSKIDLANTIQLWLQGIAIKTERLGKEYITVFLGDTDYDFSIVMSDEKGDNARLFKVSVEEQKV